MAKKLSFAIAINLLTENFKKGANNVKNYFRSMQMQIITFAAALGAGGLGLSGLLSRFKDVARETSRVLTALKNVSSGSKGFADNLRFLNDIAAKYGLQINTLVGNFSKFTASASQANMPMEQQTKVFESLSRASSAFGLSAEQTDGVFLALSQMMGKGKISSEELRKQMGEKLPIAMQAMAKAAGVSMGELEGLLKQGKLMSADIIPKFADALNEMIPNVDTDNLESSLNRLSNTFQKIVGATGFQNKYKALIDWLTGALQSASKNIQNIIIGIVAAITFFISNALTKVYRNYATTGQQIIANANITHNKLRAAIAARVEAEKNLESLKLQHAQAVGAKQTALQRQIERAKQTLSARTATVSKAHEEAKAAAAQAAAIKSRGAWATAGAAIVGTFKRIGTALKSMWNAFSPAIIISGVIALVMHFKNLYNESKRIKNIFSEYKKEAKAASNTQEIKTLQAQLAIMNDKTKSQKEINAAQGALQKMLGTEKLSQEEINKKVAKRIELLKSAAEADFYARKAVETEDKISNKAASFDKDVKVINKDLRLDPEQLKNLARLRSNPETEKDYWSELDKAVGITSKHSTLKQINVRKAINDAIKETIEDLRVLDDADVHLKNAVDFANLNTTTTGGDLDDKALKAAEKRLEALRKLDEADRQRQIEKQKFDLEMQQKSIDLMDDSFEKRTKQTLLNLEKEKLSIAEAQSDLLKQQYEYAKNKFVSVKGTDKGFEAYFAELQKNLFKDKNGMDILPEGLRPEDIAGRVGQMLKAAQKEYDKANKENVEKEKQSWNEYYKAYGDYQQKKLAITQAYAIKITKASTAGEKATLAKERDKELANLFTTLPDYNTFFTSIYSLTKTKAIEIGNLIKINLKEQLDKGIISANDYYEAIKQINEELEKSRQGIDYFNGLQTGGLDSLLNAFKQQADSNYHKASSDLNQAQNDLSKFSTQWLNALKLGDKQAGSIANSNMLSALNMQSTAQGAMQGAENMQQFAGAAQSAVGMVDKIVTAIDQSVRATQRIVDAIADLAEQRGIDTSEGTWGNVRDTMSILSQINEKAKGAWDSAKSGDGMGALASTVELIAIGFKSVNGEHKKALKLLKQQEEQQQHLYEIEKLRASLEFGKGNAIFGTDEWGKAANAISVYRQGVDNLNESLKKLDDVDVVTGSEKKGWWLWKKRKDVWTDLLKAYPDLIDANGKFDISLAETILSTRTLTDEGKQFLQQAINNAGLVEEAFTQMKDYLTGIFGDLGQSLLSSFIEAFKGTKNAMADFADNASDMLSKLVQDFIYSMRLAPIIEKATKEAENMMLDTGLTDDEKNQQLIDITGNLIEEILKQQDNVFSDLDRWGKVIADATGGKNPFLNDTTQDSTKGYSVSMDQDTGGAILGRVTGLHETGLRIESMMSAVNVDTAKCLTQSISIGYELQKQTGLLNEISQMQIKSFNLNKEMNENLSVLDSMKDSLDAIKKNTKGLAP